MNPAAYLVDYEVKFPVPGVHRIKLPARLYDKAGAIIDATPSAEVYRSGPYSDHVRFFRKEKQICFVIWDYHRCRVANREDQPVTSSP